MKSIYLVSMSLIFAFSQFVYAQDYTLATQLKAQINLKATHISTGYSAANDGNSIGLNTTLGSISVDNGAWVKASIENPIVIGYNLASFSKIAGNVPGFLVATQFNDCIKSAIVGASGPNVQLFLVMEFKAGALSNVGSNLSKFNFNFSGSNYGLKSVHCSFSNL